MIEYDVVPTPIGPCTVEVEEGEILRLYLGQRQVRGAVLKRLGPARQMIHRWFRGHPVAPRLRIEGSDFTRRVWDAVRRIPAGQTRTYGEIAQGVGRPGAARAVGSAVASNRICLFIP